MTPESNQIGMGYTPIVYIHRKRVGGIAASALREKAEIPGAIVRGSRFGSRRQGEAGTANDVRDQCLLYDVLSRELVDVQQCSDRGARAAALFQRMQPSTLAIGGSIERR